MVKGWLWQFWESFHILIGVGGAWHLFNRSDFSDDLSPSLHASCSRAAPGEGYYSSIVEDVLPAAAAAAAAAPTILAALAPARRDALRLAGKLCERCIPHLLGSMMTTVRPLPILHPLSPLLTIVACCLTHTMLMIQL